MVPRVRKADTEDELYAYAIGALARRMRSVAELKRLLRPRVDVETAHGQTLLERVIRRLKDQGYLDDAHYAAAYTGLRRDNEKFGRRRVICDLKARGVHAEVIAQAVDAAYDEVDEEQLARAYLRRKRIAKPKDQRQLARVCRQLLRAGFTSRAIFAICKQWNADEASFSGLEEEDPPG
ncbi:MAG TPA: regulatory protein RecX [Terriglobales bacterium]|nr:regulatory protein RecX [Terriglobales bacterium]